MTKENEIADDNYEIYCTELRKLVKHHMHESNLTLDRIVAGLEMAKISLVIFITRKEREEEAEKNQAEA